jgi:Arylsulfotransferase (ASST)
LLVPRRFLAGPLVAVAVVLAVVIVAGSGSRPTLAASTQLSVYPSNGSKFASPATQITIRGAAADKLAKVTVRGSKSGVHTGTLKPHSDGDGASFVPAKPFTDGEQVTVKLHRRVAGASGGVVHFTVIATAPAAFTPQKASPRRVGTATYRSRPDLQPSALKVNVHRGHVAGGDIFVSPKAGDSQGGPTIIDRGGKLVWFRPMPGDLQSFDFRVQSYNRKPVLTWWQGGQSTGVGHGEGVIYDTSYRQVGHVSAGNGYISDLHEFRLTSHGTALILAYNPVKMDLRSVGGPADGVVYDNVVQEIDVKTGLVLFEWHSLDHVPIKDSYQHYEQGRAWDYFHINSAEEMPDGDVLISSRATWGVFDIDRATGKVTWQLGGKHSTFKMGTGTHFSWQHDARPHGSSEISVYDNHVAMPTKGLASHGLVIRLDLRRKRAHLVRAYTHPNKNQSPSQGNLQLLPDGHVMVGWGGNNANFSEFSRKGTLLFDESFVSGANNSYRAYRFPWKARPADSPAAAAITANGKTTVYASWNGATEVARWRVLSGATASALAAGPTAARSDFETGIPLGGAVAFAQVEALNAAGKVIGRSPVVAAKAG